MENLPLRAVVAALCVFGIRTASMAVHSIDEPTKTVVKTFEPDDSDAMGPYQWMSQSVIQAGQIQKKASLIFGGAFANYHGRKFEMKDGQLSVGATDYLQLFYGEQFILAKGRASTSRFDVADNYYGFRAIVKRPTETDPTTISLQYQGTRPDTANARVAGATELLDGPHINIYAANYLDRKANQYQLQYTNVDVPGGFYTHSTSLSFGHDFQLTDTLLARLQGSVVGESYSAALSKSSLELRPILYGCLAFNPVPWLALEADLTAYPAGVPIASGNYTSVSSFDLYSPGGIVDQLRSDFVAFASVRLVLHGKF